MRKNLSIYMDLLRLCAAFAVVLMHARSFVMPHGIPFKLAINGTEAVAVFFVLSGFVIRFASVEKGETNWRVYASARVARIYPVVILALIVTVLADSIGFARGPAFYTGAKWFNSSTDGIALLRALTFTNEAWFTHSIFGSNEPFWSLGFEVPYYVLFGLVMFAPGRWKILTIAAWAAVMGPKVILYLPLWLLGVAAYEANRRRPQDVRPVIGMALLAFVVVAYPTVKFVLFNARGLDAFRSETAVLMIEGAAYYFVIGLLAAISMIGFDVAAGDRQLWPAPVSRAISWLVGGSFTLYLVHLPMMAAVCAIWPSVREHRLAGATALVSICLIAYALAEIAERRKRIFRMWSNRMFATR